jgi:hypothetical protein
MSPLQASRRLVKSPPELWAEVSDAASLARHLGEVGEITITRLEPETTVAWEGEHASGTVELAPAGWGTSVTLTAEPTAVAAEPEPAPPAEPAAAPAPEPPAEPETTGIEETAPIAAQARRGWLARLFRRPAEPESSPADRAGGVAEDDSTTPLAESTRATTGPARRAAEPEHEGPQPTADPLEDVLTHALDSLGQAHHRPFSRG